MTSSLTPEQRRLRGQLGAYASWAQTTDPVARTAPARRAFDERFEREVDPDGVLPVEARQRRAEAARRAYFAQLAWKSSRARSKAARARHQAQQLETEAAAAEAELMQADGAAAANHREVPS